MVRTVCAAVVIALVGGCTGLEPAALSAGASVAQSGVTLLGRGKAQTIRLATFEACKDATADVAAELGLKLNSRRGDDDFERRSYVDDQNQVITIEIKRRTAEMSQLKSDVGLFGPNVLAVFVLERIATRVDPPKPTP